MPNRIGFGVQATGVGKAESELDHLKNKFEAVRAQGAKGFAIGVAAGATQAAIGLASRAVGELGDLVGEANQAFLEEERSVKRLGASLAANIPNWNGNTDAIEKVLKARMALGFSDEEQRDSLAKLVVATHDSAKALEVQRTAMDLARLKGISLAEAGDALTKVEAGSFRILKSLGIALKDGATATDALRAVQKAAAGQAEAFAQTNEGKLLTSQIKVNEAMEKAGRVTLPIYAEVVSHAADAVAGLGVAFDALNGKLPKTSQETVDAGHQLVQFLGMLGGPAGAIVSQYGDKWVDASDTAKQAIAQVADELDRSERSINQSSGKVGDSLGTIDAASQATADKIRADTRSMSKNFDDLVGRMADDAQSAIDDYFNPIETHSDILADRQKLHAAERARELAKTKAAERAAADDITQALDDEAGHLDDLGKQHKLTAKDVEDYRKDVNAAYASVGKKVPAELQKVIDKLADLAAFEAASNVKITVKGDFGGGLPGGKKARGGPAGGRTLVGEEGPEIVDLPGGSFVHDANQTKQMQASSGPVTQNFYITGADVSSPDRIATIIRRGQTIANGRPWDVGGAFG